MNNAITVRMGTEELIASVMKGKLDHVSCIVELVSFTIFHVQGDQLNVLAFDMPFDL